MGETTAPIKVTVYWKVHEVMEEHPKVAKYDDPNYLILYDENMEIYKMIPHRFVISITLYKELK